MPSSCCAPVWATVELYKDGTKVGDATAGTDGKYTISNVSTGTYTVKAKNSDGTLNGSASVTVAADSISNADVTLQKWQKGDVNKDGEINGQDLQRLYEHLKGENPLPTEDVSLGNVNGDNTVNGQDWQRLYEHVKGEKPLT